MRTGSIFSIIAAICIACIALFFGSPDKYTTHDFRGPALFEVVSAVAAPIQDEGPDPGMCFFCHIDAVEQWMESRHYKNEIDCVGCHGESEDHIRVEDNTIRPGVYFTEGGTTDIKFCRESCHEELPADPHEKVDDCVSCHLAHEFPSFKDPDDQ